MDHDRVTLQVHDGLPEGPARTVDEGLGAANDAAASLHEVQALSVFAHGPGGEVLGGAVGRTWGECAELQQLWVDPAHRRQGLGARLVQAFEGRAVARGCLKVYLETYSFQAPALYRGLGYGVVLELSGYAPGIVKYTMLRQLGPG